MKWYSSATTTVKCLISSFANYGKFEDQGILGGLNRMPDKEYVISDLAHQAHVQKG